MGIENGKKKPSIDVLYRLVQALGVSADAIFYPEKLTLDSSIDKLSRMLKLCTEKEIKAVTAMLDVLLEGRK